MLRKLTMLTVVFALVFSSIALSTHASLADHKSPAANGAIKVEGGLISGTAADGSPEFQRHSFAAPPVGDCVGSSPSLSIAWRAFASAMTSGRSARKRRTLQGSMYYSPPQKQSEDCLYLNVWTAAKAGEKRPVMVWIHGGALTRGSGATRVLRRDGVREKGVVLVTINYRLGPLGYLAHPELTADRRNHASGNYGVWIRSRR